MSSPGHDEQRSVHLFSMHTSPLAQPGDGDAGGLNVYVAHLSQALVREGYSVEAFTLATDVAQVPHSHGDPERSASGRTTVIPGYSVHTLYLPEIRGASKEELSAWTEVFGQACSRYAVDHGLRPDVLHAHYWLSGEAAMHYRSALGSSAPLVLTLHTSALAKNLQSDHGERPEPQHRADVERFLLTNADATVVNTPHELHHMSDLYGAPEERMHVIPPGVDLETFHPGEPRKAGNPDEFLVVFAGRPQPLKGPEILIDAVALAAPSIPGLRLEIRGTASPDYLDGLKARARERGLEDRCAFLPASGRVELAAAFRAADAVACPSSSETFGLVALEAQACGVPVLASDVTGLRAALDDGRAGRLVSPRTPEAWCQAILDLASDSETRIRLGQAGAAHARSLGWDQAAYTTAHLYDRLLNTTKSSQTHPTRFEEHHVESGS
ncbi:glycosyltransferase [Kocuria massiliensis]|uniref:glycosyltransferase n=1 Tax=Kocuria massiliensis TaxID=1926282 RepID=UPI00117ABCCF|nr:glycosyltransferase [Kocuria massiliensis]